MGFWQWLSILALLGNFSKLEFQSSGRRDVPARNAGCTLNVSKEIRNRPCSYSYSLLVFTVELNHLLWCAIVVTDREITRYLLNFVNTRPLRYFFLIFVPEKGRFFGCKVYNYLINMSITEVTVHGRWTKKTDIHADETAGKKNGNIWFIFDYPRLISINRNL